MSVDNNQLGSSSPSSTAQSKQGLSKGRHGAIVLIITALSVYIFVASWLFSAAYSLTFGSLPWLRQNVRAGKITDYISSKYQQVKRIVIELIYAFIALSIVIVTVCVRFAFSTVGLLFQARTAKRPQSPAIYAANDKEDEVQVVQEEDGYNTLDKISAYSQMYTQSPFNSFIGGDTESVELPAESPSHDLSRESTPAYIRAPSIDSQSARNSSKYSVIRKSQSPVKKTQSQSRRDRESLFNLFSSQPNEDSEAGV